MAEALLPQLAQWSQFGQVATSLSWLALGGAGALAMWWHARPSVPRLFRRDSALYLRGRRHAQLRTYRVQAEAEQRAEQLLREVIGETAFTRLLKRGYLDVQSPTFPSRIYLVPQRQGPVTVCENGQPVMRLCVQCIDRVPDYDTVVMHKLMIEGNEREYLRIANRV